ncbi:MAG: NAD kinase [Lactobacillus sp.]|nr:NAD kinase [Lactobacillus sp.]
MKIAIVHNDQDKSLGVVKNLKELIQNAGLTLDNQYPDIVITVGGDGTFISAVHKYFDQIDSVRFIGIHTGHLGFYTDWRNYDIDKMIQVLRNDQAETVDYPILEITAKTSDGEHVFYAVNEAVVKRSVKTLEADVYIGNTILENFRGDGMCVSTPMGSTAYNKSLGGAVIEPTLRAMQLTEIASINSQVFTTVNAPVVVAPDSEIIIKTKPAEDLILTCDGKVVAQNDILELSYKISHHHLQFDRFGHNNFWTRVKESFIGLPHASI